MKATAKLPSGASARKPIDTGPLQISVGAPTANQGYTLREFRIIDNPNSTGDVTTLSGALTGTDTRVDLLKTGGGVLELLATNTYAGATHLAAGTVRLTGPDGRLASPYLNLAGGSVFEIDNSASNVSGRLTDSGGPRLSLVTRVPTAPYWKDALPIVGGELGLSGASAHG